ncbi:hypothetical protein CGRA01v4_03105 [Colletotrichum graminicola]|nr:hypothetical protein CGRA01v4_03105 [Colletotrichum graminicola]
MPLGYSVSGLASGLAFQGHSSRASSHQSPIRPRAKTHPSPLSAQLSGDRQ